MINTGWLRDVKIRPATAIDLPALEWDGEYVHFRRLYRQVFESVSKETALIWIADLSEVGLVGQLFVQLLSGRTELADGSGRAYIYGFRIKPIYRSSGLGGVMLAFVEKDLFQRGFSHVMLNVGKDNPSAQKFYQRLGYRIVADEPGIWSYIDHLGNCRDVHEPAWRMEKKIR
jgi:ribosomal protein S18 acetylase RimI-like enzyme